MIIELPGNYSGGELTVRHQSKCKKFSFGGPAGLYNFYYVAFYADCQYKAKPVTNGYRLSLVYSLECSGSITCTVPGPPRNRKAVSTIATLMKQWNEDDSASCPSLMVYMLEKEYSTDLSFESLNSFDKAVVSVLSCAQKKFAFDFYLARLCFEDKWTAAVEESNLEFVEDTYDKICLIGSSASATNLKSPGGECIERIDFDAEYIDCIFFYEAHLASSSEEIADSDEVSIFGNPLCTLTKKYLWAALLIWPLKNHYKNLGIKNVVSMIDKDVQGQKVKKSQVEARLRALVHHYTLPDQLEHLTAEVCSSVLQCLLRHGSAKLVRGYFDALASSAACRDLVIESSSIYAAVVDVGSKFGWDILRSSLQAIFDTVPSITDGLSVGKYCQFLFNISQRPSSETQKEVCRGLASNLVTFLVQQKERKLEPPGFPWLFSTKPIPFCPKEEFLIALFRSLEEVDGDVVISTLVQEFSRKPANYPLRLILTPVCDSLLKSMTEGVSNGKALRHILSYCISTLEEIATKTSWYKAFAFTCTCEFCVRIQKFLQHPLEEQDKFEVDKMKCDHLLCQLRAYNCLSEVSAEYVRDTRTLKISKKEAKVGLSQEEKGMLTHFLSLKEKFLHLVDPETVSATKEDEPAEP